MIQKLYDGWGRLFVSQYGATGLTYSVVTGPRYDRACMGHCAQCARLGAGSRYNDCIVAERGGDLV